MRRAWAMLLFFWALRCSAPAVPDVALPDPIAEWGAACDPTDAARQCLALAVAASGWCQPETNGVHAQCVLPCGGCDGVCSTDGACYRVSR